VIAAISASRFYVVCKRVLHRLPYMNWIERPEQQSDFTVFGDKKLIIKHILIFPQ